MEAADECQNVVPRAPHPMLRRLRGAAGRVAALGPAADELLADRRGKKWQELRALRIVHRRVADVVADGTRARGVEDERRVERRAGRDQAVVEAADRVGARIEIAEPPPEPATVLKRIELRG